MKTILEFIQKNKTANFKSELTLKEFKQLIENHSYIILMEEDHYENDDPVNDIIYIMELGNNDDLGAIYGQDKYLAGSYKQPIDGEWPSKETENTKATVAVFNEFEKRTNIKCKYRFTYDGSHYFLSVFSTTKDILTILNDTDNNFSSIKIYDTRKK